MYDSVGRWDGPLHYYTTPQGTPLEPLWNHFGIQKEYRGTADPSTLSTSQDIATQTPMQLWRSVQADQNLMRALKRRCKAQHVPISTVFGVSPEDFEEIQKVARRDIGVANTLLCRTNAWTTEHDTHLHAVMDSITTREPMVGEQNYHNWWRQVAADMSSRMKRVFTVKKVRRRSKLLGQRRIQRGFHATGTEHQHEGSSAAAGPSCQLARAERECAAAETVRAAALKKTIQLAANSADAQMVAKQATTDAALALTIAEQTAKGAELAFHRAVQLEAVAGTLVALAEAASAAAETATSMHSRARGAIMRARQSTSNPTKVRRTAEYHPPHTDDNATAQEPSTNGPHKKRSGVTLPKADEYDRGVTRGSIDALVHASCRLHNV